MQDRSNLFLRTRDRLRALDPNANQRELVARARALIAMGIVLADRNGEPVFVRTEHQER